MSAPISIGNGKPNAVEPFDPEPSREWVRKWLAIASMVVLGAILVSLTFASLVFDITEGQASIVIQTVLPSTLGITGSVMGFYYGGERQKKA